MPFGERMYYSTREKEGVILFVYHSGEEIFIHMKKKLQKMFTVTALVLATLALSLTSGGCIWGHGDRGGWHGGWHGR
jgi:hypothetical protein